MGNPLRDTKEYKQKLAANRLRKATQRQMLFVKKPAVKHLVSKAVLAERAKWVAVLKEKMAEIEELRARSNGHMRQKNTYSRSSEAYKVKVLWLEERVKYLKKCMCEDRKKTVRRSRMTSPRKSRS